MALYKFRIIIIIIIVSLYISALASSAFNALGALNTAETDAPSAGDKSWRCWGLGRAGPCPASSRPSDQPRQKHDGSTCVQLNPWNDAAPGRTFEGAACKSHKCFGHQLMTTANFAAALKLSPEK